MNRPRYPKGFDRPMVLYERPLLSSWSYPLPDLTAFNIAWFVPNLISGVSDFKLQVREPDWCGNTNALALYPHAQHRNPSSNTAACMVPTSSTDPAR